MDVVRYSFVFRYQTAVREVSVPLQLLRGRELSLEAVRDTVDNHPGLLQALLGFFHGDYLIMLARPDNYRSELERVGESITLTRVGATLVEAGPPV